ncbi:hypothetical protein RRG08_066044 [Elysia crispata]|uniref:Uncharacterized protein n=1 Tax=Elysia crispata TaxID=231223 RepID=A0AAE1CRR0_9GAST|nr:hypothetical protein RRG08_066044 [Elysia crispata]
MEKVRVSRFCSKHVQTKEIVQEDQLDQSMKVEGVEMWRGRRKRKKEILREIGIKHLDLETTTDSINTPVSGEILKLSYLCTIIQGD